MYLTGTLMCICVTRSRDNPLEDGGDEKKIYKLTYTLPYKVYQFYSLKSLVAKYPKFWLQNGVGNSCPIVY